LPSPEGGAPIPAPMSWQVHNKRNIRHSVLDAESQSANKPQMATKPKEHGGARAGAGRKAKAFFFEVGWACEAEQRRLAEARAFAEYEATPRVRAIREHQTFIRAAMVRHRKPEGFTQPEPKKIAAGKVKEIESAGRLATVHITEGNDGRDIVLAKVAAEFAISTDTVNRHWKKFRRMRERLSGDQKT